MDILQRAQAKREWHLSQAARLEAFLATAFDLEQDLKSELPVPKRTDAEKAAPLQAKRVNAPRGGVGQETLEAAVAIVREYGPMSTRDMLPLVRAKGIEIPTDDVDRAIAILSARISKKELLETYRGKWRLVEMSSASDADQKETEDYPATDRSSASLFAQAMEDSDAAPLA